MLNYFVIVTPACALLIKLILDPSWPITIALLGMLALLKELLDSQKITDKFNTDAISKTFEKCHDLINEQKKSNQEISDLKSKVSQLSIASGFKTLGQQDKL